MMKTYNLLCLIGILFCFSSCSVYNETYFGTKYPATDTVETFYAAKDVKRPYKVIGHMNMPIYQILSVQEKAKNKLINRAKEVGANALIFSDLSRQTTTSGDELSIKAEALVYTDK